MMLVALALATGVSDGGDALVGCEGVARVAGTLAEMAPLAVDFSAVRVSLSSRTTEKQLLETQCAPNGYYFLPLYDAGDFLLRVDGPSGWHVEQREVPVSYGRGDARHRCTSDVDFIFDGFAASGAVKRSCSSRACARGDAALVGHGGAAVELYRSSDSTLVGSATTRADGSYIFECVPPGQYDVRLPMAVDRASTLSVAGAAVHVTWGSTHASRDIVVAGFSVRGRVELQGGDPVAAAHIFLLAHPDVPACAGAAAPALACSAALDAAAAPAAAAAAAPWTVLARKRSAPLCVTTSDTAGVFTFAGVPCGRYVAVLAMSGGDGSASSAALPFEVVDRAVDLERSLIVSGFMLSGRVVDPSGRGVDNVSVVAVRRDSDGRFSATTNAEGRYVLEELVPGRYTLNATKEHASFRPVHSVELLPTLAELPDVTLERWSVCGSIRLDEALRDGESFSSITVRLRSATIDAVLEVARPVGGRFCTSAPPGAYVLDLVPTESVVSGEETQLLYAHSEVRVTVPANAPVLDLQLDLAPPARIVRGRVLCIGESARCGPSITATLRKIEADSSAVAIAARTTRVASNGGHFEFRDVKVGHYEVTVAHDEGQWCWEGAAAAAPNSFVSASAALRIDTEDVLDIKFRQAGYALRVEASHDATLKCEHERSGNVSEVALHAGVNVECIHSAGKFALTPHSCFRFENSTYAFDSAAPAPIVLKATKVRVAATISIVGMGVAAPLLEPLPMLEVGGLDSPTTLVQPTEIVKGSDGVVLHYEEWAALGSRLVLTPRAENATRSCGGAALIFSPRSREGIAGTSQCSAQLDAFVGRVGIFLSGSVSPPLSGVAIAATHDGTKRHLNEGALIALTDTAGHYTFGPLPADAAYEVRATLAGHHFARRGATDFVQTAMGAVDVTAFVGSGSDSPLPDVLFTLSGESYRKNVVSDSSGQFSFEGLTPGSYFIRSMLKEYSFAQSGRTVEVTEGKRVTVRYEATRTAFSCYGSVLLLDESSATAVDHAPIRVLASSANGEHDEAAVVDSNGFFRIRGLLPDTTVRWWRLHT